MNSKVEVWWLDTETNCGQKTLLVIWWFELSSIVNSFHVDFNLKQIDGRYSKLNLIKSLRISSYMSGPTELDHRSQIVERGLFVQLRDMFLVFELPMPKNLLPF